jgi:hypothetical protein
MLLEVAGLVEHRRAGHIQHTADDDAPGLPGRVHVHRLEHPRQPHRASSSAHRPPHRATAVRYPFRASATWRAMSRFASRSAISRRRSHVCLPLARPSSSFALPWSVM